MTDAPNRILNPEWSLVVIYCGTDPYFHQRDSHSPNRPACRPGRSPGVLTPLMHAQDSGLMPCGQCWERIEMSGEMRPLHPVSPRSFIDLSPLVVDLAVDMPVSRKTLFAYLANLENNPEWNWAVKTVTSLKAADPARGTRYSQERVAGGAGIDVLEIARYEPDEYLEITGVINEGHVTYRHHLVRLTSKSTRLRTTVELVPNEPVARPDLYTARLVAAISANLETLRSRLANRTSARLTSRSRPT